MNPTLFLKGIKSEPWLIIYSETNVIFTFVTFWIVNRDDFICSFFDFIVTSCEVAHIS